MKKLMRKFRVELEVLIKENWANISDFEREIELFNKSNEGVIEVKIMEIELI